MKTAMTPSPTPSSTRCGVVWCGVVWCGVVWCGVVWCGVVLSSRRVAFRSVALLVRDTHTDVLCCGLRM
jgi:hypothetical protein